MVSLRDRLEETLARRKKIRHGWVYIHRRPTGPPPPKTPRDEALTDLIRDAAVNFDFSPILSGDRIFAKKVADDFIRTLRDYVSADGSLTGISQEDLNSRLATMWPWWYHALSSFRSRLHTASKVF